MAIINKLFFENGIRTAYHAYAMKPSVFGRAINKILSYTATGYSNPAEGIISAYALPFSPFNVTDERETLTPLIIGRIQTDEIYECITIDGDEEQFNYTITFPRNVFDEVRHDNFLDYSDKTNLQIHAPFFPIINISTKYMYTGFDVYLTISLTSNVCSCKIISRGNNKVEIYEGVSECGMTIPVLSSNYSRISAQREALKNQGDYDILQGIVGLVPAAVASYVTASPIPLAYGGANLINSIGNYGKRLETANSLKEDISIRGSYGYGSSAISTLQCYAVVKTVKTYEPENYNSLFGKPSGKYLKLSSCVGYTEISSIHLEIPCTTEELNEIQKFLYEGVIIK